MKAITVQQIEDVLAAPNPALVARVCEMACRLVRCSSEEEFLRELPGAARDLFEADCVWVALIEGEEVVLRTHAGLRRSDMAQRWRMRLGDGIAGAVAFDGQSRIVKDYRYDSRRRPEIKGLVDSEGLRGGLHVPVYRGSTIIGVMSVASYQVERFGSVELEMLTAFMALAHRVAESIHRREAEVLARVRADTEVMALRESGVIELAMAEETASEGGIGRALIRLAQWVDAPIALCDKAGHVLFAAGHTDGETGTRIELVGNVNNELDLFVYDDGRMTPVQRDACARCASLVTMAVLRDRSRFEAELRIRSELFDELLDGRIANSQDMLLRSALVGVDLEIPRVVVCLTIRKADRDNAAFVPRLVDKVQKYMADHVRGGIATIRDGHLALLLNADHNATLQDRLDIGARLLDNMRPYVDTKQMAVGVGRVCQTLDDYPLSYSEAEITSRQVAVGKLDKRVAVIEDLGIYGILALSTGGKSLERLIDEKLGPLIEADHASRSEYVRTLRALFENDRHLERTARALFVHVNTLRYRLDRIQEILGVNLRDSRSRFLVELAVYAESAAEENDGANRQDDLDETSIERDVR